MIRVEIQTAEIQWNTLQLSAVIMRSNIVRYDITSVIITETEAEYLSDAGSTKDTP